MVKPGLGLFTARRKSQSNVLDDAVAAPASPDAAAPAAPQAAPADTDSGGFRLMSRNEVDKANERRKTQEKEKGPKFPRFSGFGSVGNKGRNHSFEDESPGSSKRDSKSSSGTQFSSSRPYINGQHGSTSTLPSSTDTGSDDNLFANVARPQFPQHNSTSPGSYFGLKKSLPALPKTSSGAPPKDNMVFGSGKRDRAMTASSYASTAIPPKLDADLNFGDSSFDDMFSGIARKESPEYTREPAGRSLLAEKRTFHAEPIKIHSELDVEPALASWDSRNSADNLMASPLSDDDSPPPPPPPHKYSHYAPLAPESPGLHQPASFPDQAAPAVRKPFMAEKEKSYRESSPDQATTSVSSSSANSFQTPLSSRSASTTATPKATLPPAAIAYNDDDDDNLFAPPVPKPQAYKPQAPAPKPQAPAPKPLAGEAAGSRVMTQAEFREYQKRQMSQPPADDSSEDEDYEDEEEAIRMREEQEVLRRKNQQMHFAREAMRRSTTAPGNLNRSESLADSMGFPSETSIKADEWEDEDIPLGILAQHGFPSQTRNRFPSQPTNVIPSHFPDRPSSAGPATNRASQANLPAFARNLPADPHSSFIGGGLVQHANRESLGFNNFPRGPASVAGDAMGGGMGMGMAGPSPLMYQDAGMTQPSLVDQIQMRDMTKKKYMGGASNKKPQEGPFTGMLGNQMNTNGQQQNQQRMTMMNGGMNGGMNPMMGMGGQMPMMGMGMGQMGYGMPQQNDFMQMQQFQQMQQMYAMQQMQFQMQQMQQQQPQDPRMSMAQDPRMSMAQDPRMSMAQDPRMAMGQDPRMSMAFGNNNMGGGGGFLNVPGMQNAQNRPMSYMSQQRPYSTAMGPSPGYTPSIAPSERSNVGLSARYRPVVNNSDAISNGTSMTLQATSGGANQNKNGAIKGILKKGAQASVPESADDEDWSTMAARKKKFGGAGKENSSSGLEDLTRGLNI